MIVAAVAFVKNSQFHRDLDFPVLSDYALTLANETLEKTSGLENPFIQHTAPLATWLSTCAVSEVLNRLPIPADRKSA